MTEGVIWRQLVRFALPMMVGLLFQQLYNTVDTIVVGRFVGKEALAAVGSTSSICFMLVGLCAGLATGASVIISQRFGAHEQQKLHDAVQTTISITLISAVLFTMVGLLIVEPMLRLMDTPPDVYGEARDYLTIYFAGISGLMIYNMGSGILRAVGDSRRPLYFLCFSAVMNTVLDLLFVVQFRMGVRGVAYATVASQMISALLVLLVLTRDQSGYGIRWRELCINREALRGILAIGLPSGLQQGITAFSNVFVQSYINFFGSACMAGWSSYNKLDAFITLPLQAISLASTTFVGQNYGAKQYLRARKGANQAMTISVLVTVLCSVLTILLAGPLITLFTNEGDVIRFGVYFVYVTSPFYFLLCFNNIYGGALRGVGNAKMPTLIMLLSFVVFRQLYLLMVKLLCGAQWLPSLASTNVTQIAGNPLFFVAISYPVGWVLCSVLITLFYRRSALYKGVEDTAHSIQ